MGTKGRKAREVTNEMIEDLKTISKEDFCIKHECGELFFLKAYHSNIKIVKNKVESVEAFLPAINILLSKGTVHYLKYLSDRNSHYDKAICDIHHKIELDKCTQGEKIVLHDILSEILETRREYKDSFAFASTNVAKLTTYFNLIKEIEKTKKGRLNRKYSTRVLVEEFGVTIGGK